MYSSDDQNTDDDDDDDYDVPPAFRMDFNHVARLSSVGETGRCTTTVGYDADDTNNRDDDDDDNDDDYDVPPAFRLDYRDVETDAWTTTDKHSARNTQNYDDDDDNYDILPNTLCPTTLEAGYSPPVNQDVDDLYDYLTTDSELQSVSAPRSSALTDNELYDFIAPKGGSDGGWSDSVGQRTSNIGPDVDDNIGKYGEAERQLGHLIGGDGERTEVDNVRKSTASADDLYDYPPLRSSPEGTTHDAVSSDNCPSSAATVLGHQLSSSSSSSDDHYDVLPGRPVSSSDQLSVRKCTGSESISLYSKVGVNSRDNNLYDFITTKDTCSVTAVSCEAAGAPKDNSNGVCRGPATAVDKRQQSSSSDDDYEVLPATSLDDRSIHRSSDAAVKTASRSIPIPVVSLPPSSCSTLSAGRPDHPHGQSANCDVEQTGNKRSDVTRCSVGTPVMSDQSLHCPNKPSFESMLTAMCTVSQKK